MSVRAPGINQVMLAGNIVRDAEMRNVGDNLTTITTFTLAHNHRYKDKGGNWQQSVAFADVETWGVLAERLVETCKKGTPVIVQGNLKQNKWEDKEGNAHTKLMIRADHVHVLSHLDKK